MRIRIPLRCPECGGPMYAVRYEPVLSVLKYRSWQYCKDCGFVRESEDFKRSLFTV